MLEEGVDYLKQFDILSRFLMGVCYEKGACGKGHCGLSAHCNVL